MEGVRLGYEPRKKRALLRWVPPISEKRRGTRLSAKERREGGGARLLGRAGPLDGPSARGTGVLGRERGKQARGLAGPSAAAALAFPFFLF